MDAVSVELVGTALSTLLELAFFLNDPDELCRAVKPWNEVVRICLDVRFEEDLVGASPKMKNLMNAPISSTTDSWPTSKPCVKVNGIVKVRWL